MEMRKIAISQSMRDAASTQFAAFPIGLGALHVARLHRTPFICRRSFRALILINARRTIGADASKMKVLQRADRHQLMMRAAM